MEKTETPLEKLIQEAGLGSRNPQQLQQDLDAGIIMQAGHTAFCLKFVAQTAETDPQQAERELEQMLPHVHPELMPLVEVMRGHIFLRRRTGGRERGKA